MPSRDRRHLVLTLVVLGGSSLVLTGCVPLGQPGAAPADLAGAVPLVEPAGDPAPASAPATGELVGPDDPEIQAAMRAWKAEGRAPIIRRDEFIQYPYGLTEALVSCQPLRVCDIELEAGEEVLQVSLGDGSRWLASPAFSGERESVTPHVLVKPTELGIATNAVITTTRRTYYLGLVSRSDATPVRRVKFYYPQDLVEQANGIFRARAAQRKQDRETTIARLRSPAVDSLNFDYEISGDAVPWKPVRVFDDGAHVYIQMPPAMRVTEAPALLVRTRTGEGALVNYRLRRPYYVVDTLFETALLVMGVGTHQERVTIRRLSPPTLGESR